MNQYFDIDVNSTTSYSAILLKLLIIEHRDFKKKKKLREHGSFHCVYADYLFTRKSATCQNACI